MLMRTMKGYNKDRIQNNLNPRKLCYHQICSQNHSILLHNRYLEINSITLICLYPDNAILRDRHRLHFLTPKVVDC